MAGNNSLELEINKLFQEGNSLEIVCTELVSKYEKSDIVSPDELESLSHFLISCGQHRMLFKFYIKCLRKESLPYFPWAFLYSSFKKLNLPIEAVFYELCEASMNEENQLTHLSKQPDLVNSFQNVFDHVSSSKQHYEAQRLETKNKLIAQLNQNRIYQLAEQEEQTLQQLVKIFPNDFEVKLLHQAHLEKKADDILAKIRSQNYNSASLRQHRSISPELAEENSKIEKNTRTLADKIENEAPEQIYNLSLLALQLDLHDLALELIEKVPESQPARWLKAELLFESSRFLDLLNYVQELEKSDQLTPESTYGLVYLKSQAYFGLGQKDMAINLLETLVAKVGSYRSSEALLHEWKSL